MKIRKEYLFLGLIILLIGIISIYEFLAQNKQAQTPLSAPTNKVEERIDKVTALIEFLPEKSDTATSAFQVALDTHSENLDTFDFYKDLSIEKNGETISVSTVQNMEGANHHRKADVYFPATAIPFTIIVTNVSGVLRTEILFS